MLETSLFDIGFRYVFQDGLSILQNERPLEPERREFVLTDLSELLEKALIGIDISKSNALFAGSEKKRAFDIYLTFKRHLQKDLAWRQKVELSKSAIDLLKEGNNLSEDQKEALKFVLSRLLDTVRRKNMVPEVPPEIAFR